ncbi:alpha-glucuronidase [Saccharicrinis sp. FJH2]|uniref:alpha-glucuronidase n=1 Tax=Saccharicrinis sp. FJH65 TaxID=3344659 RepID=UPI0035F2E437
MTRTLLLLTLLLCLNITAEDGHQLWLRAQNTGQITVKCKTGSPALDIAAQELHQGWQGKDGARIKLKIKLDKRITGDGFRLTRNRIYAQTDLGILYGVYELLRRQHTGAPIDKVIQNPSYDLRLLNHWDNLDGSIERGYAGSSIFWRKGKDAFTVTAQDRNLWTEYARANASVGINGTVLNNVNASPQMLSPKVLKRVQEIADVLRPYGIKPYLAVKFSSPSLIGGLKTSDPLDTDVIRWWQEKVSEIYALIPDFGGFLVKANSEGQPGPQDFGRSHADGANMLANALKPYGGIVMWRAFVYKPSGDDRVKQAYKEFVPLDGKFRDNVIIQSKNGPLDFQPREPFSPLFGGMKETAVMPELQITQEYLGQNVHLVFLAPMWEEFFNSDTYMEGPRSTIARYTGGDIIPFQHTLIAGVSNIGSDPNWCGHPFAQANWYAFGRMAWNHSLTSEQIADEWLKMTFVNERQELSDTSLWAQHFLQPVKQMMLESRETAVNYMMPLGLHHIFAANHHYGPGPWWAPAGARKDWTPPYYHQADDKGIGFDRTRTGSNAVSQYHELLPSVFNDLKTCPEKYLLWFHHVPWDYKLHNGNTLWNELCNRYDRGVKEVDRFQKTWNNMGLYLDSERFYQVQGKLREQYRNARIWKDACLLYFQQFSAMPLPDNVEAPVYKLNELMQVE